MNYQQTILNEISCKGIGIHTGKKVFMKIKPAEEDTGIVFTRIDIDSKPRIEVKIEMFLTHIEVLKLKKITIL